VADFAGYVGGAKWNLRSEIHSSDDSSFSDHAGDPTPTRSIRPRAYGHSLVTHNSPKSGSSERSDHLTEETHETARMAQVNQIHQALGQFVVEFSRMVHTMESDLYFSVGGNQHLFFAVTAELTADPLARAWRSIMSESPDLTDEDRKILSNIHAEVVALIQLRNDWSHGTWFVGYGNESSEWSRAILERFKNSSKGLTRPSELDSTPTAGYILDVASHVKFVTQAVMDFGANVHLLRDKATSTHPTGRIRIAKIEGRRQFQMSSNGVDWQSSQMPLRSTQPS
jgi:hypothetical protein